MPPASLAPTTTAEQDLTQAGRRHINVMWERTQQVIAILVTVWSLGVVTYLTVYGDKDIQLLAFAFLSNIGILVINTYFQRTNHTKVGGVGADSSGR